MIEYAAHGAINGNDGFVTTMHSPATPAVVRWNIIDTSDTLPERMANAYGRNVLTMRRMA
jgi:hypothetical protein